MKKEITGFVTIAQDDISEKERKLRLAQFAVLLSKWKVEDDSKKQKDK
jgi:hypothetical protein